MRSLFQVGPAGRAGVSVCAEGTAGEQGGTSGQALCASPRAWLFNPQGSDRAEVGFVP